MPSKKPRSPTEKKGLSYAHDCRNNFGENDKAARKTIPARKAGENRKARRKAGHVISVIGRLPEDEAAIAESSIRLNLERVGGWKKGSDIPLVDFIDLQARRRSWRGLGPNRKSESD